MAASAVPVTPVKRVGSLFDELVEMERRLSKRAFELFENQGWMLGHDLDDWLKAERELLWRPCVELTETDAAVRVSCALAGLTAKDVEVLAEPNRLTVRADTKHGHRKEEGDVRFCEFHKGSLYRSIVLPCPVVPEKAKAEMKEGILTVTLPKAKEPAGKKIPIKG